MIFGLLRAGTFSFCGVALTNRTGPVGPNRCMFRTAAVYRTEETGQGGESYVTSGRRPLCGVKDAAKRLPVRFIRNRQRAFLGTLDCSVERSRASPRSGRSKGHSDAARPSGGVTRKGEPSGPSYAGHILGMCRRPLCPFLRCMKFLLMQRLTCHICRFSGSTGGKMNFHK